jgi:hypothetical protein
MFERLRQSDMKMCELGEKPFKRVDIVKVENYEAIMKLQTRIKKHLVPRKMQLFLSMMVMVGMLFMSRLYTVLMTQMMHKEEDRPDQGGFQNPT